MPVVIALPELLALAGLFLALGMVVMGDAFTRALFQVTEAGVGWIPWIGKKASNGVRAVSQRVNAVFSHAAVRLEGAISASWHVLAALIDQTGAAIWEATQVAAQALWMVEVKYPLAAISAAAHAAHGAVNRTTKITTTTVKRVTVVTGVTAAQLSRLGRRVGRLEHRVAAVAAAAAGTVALPFPRLGSLERGAHAAKARLGKLERRFGRKAFAASVATALGVLGLSWTRRSCVKRNNELLCRTDFGALEALLAGAVLAIGSQSVERFANAMLAAEDEMVGVLERMIVELGEAAK